MRRLVTIAIGVTLALAVSCVSVSFASAREYTPPTLEDFQGEHGGFDDYALVQNPDGTYTEYYMPRAPSTWPPPSYESWEQGNTYSGQSIQEADQVVAEEGVDAGTTGQDGSIVFDANGATEYGAEEVVESLRTGEPYATDGEALVGDELIDEGVAEGVLPSLAASVGALGGAVLTAGGIVAAGVAVGAGIDELFGFPAFAAIAGLGYESESPSWCSGGYEKCEWNANYELGEITLDTVNKCNYHNFRTYDLEPIPYESGELCEFPQMHYHFTWSYYDTYNKKTYKESCSDQLDGDNDGYGRGGGAYIDTFPECGAHSEAPDSPTNCPIGETWVQCFQGFAGSGGIFAEPQAEYNLLYQEFYVPLGGNVSYDAFPAKGLTEKESHVGKRTSGSVEALPAVKTPVVIPKVNEIPEPLRHRTFEKAKKRQTPEEEERKVPPVPLIPPLEEGKELPSPLEPTVPEIEPGGEEWTRYREAVEKAGLTPNENVLPETAIDPSVGPNDVTGADPAPGSREAPGTGVTVDVNPSNAPIPGEAPHGIGPPTEPGFDLPKLGVLCHGFPFGVPCWLVSTIVAMSTTAKAPDWTIVPEIEVSGHKVPEGKFDFAKLEPIMEIVRPAMIAFTTIGIVLLFYSFAKGGGPPSGGNTDSAPMSEPDDDVYL